VALTSGAAPRALAATGASFAVGDARGVARNPAAGFGVPLRILQKSCSAVKSNSFTAVSWDRPN